MEAWAWLTAYLVGFALLQLVLYRYFRRRGSSSDQPTGDRHGARADAGHEPRTGATEASARSGPDTRPSGDDDRVHCKHCGALNEQGATFKYCRECTQPIQ